MRPLPTRSKASCVPCSAAISERAKAEEKVASDFADDGSSQRNLAAELKSTTSRFEAEQNPGPGRVRGGQERSAQPIPARRRRHPCRLRRGLGGHRTQFGTEVEAAEKEKADASWMVSSVLDDTSHESPRFQFETFKKRLTTTSDRLRDQRKEADETAEAASELMQSRRQGPRIFELDPIENPQDVQECEERFGAAIRTICEGKALPSQQKLSRLFGGIVAGAFVLFGMRWSPARWSLSSIRPGSRCRRLGQQHVDDGLGGRGGRLMIIFMAILYGVARSKSGHVYLDLQQAYADLKTVHKRWMECAKVEMHERKQQFERRYAEVVAQRDRALANVEGKAAQRMGDATARKQRERAEADKKYPALLKEIADGRDRQLQALDDDFQQKMSDLSGQKARPASGPSATWPSGRQNAGPKRARPGPRLPRSGGPARRSSSSAVADFESRCRGRRSTGRPCSTADGNSPNRCCARFASAITTSILRRSPKACRATSN